MTEPIAENRFTLTKDLFYEGYSRVYRENHGRSLKTLCLVLAALWLAFAAFSAFSGQGMIGALAELVVLCLVILWATVMLPRGKAKRAWKGDEERVIRFYKDHLEVETGERQKFFHYSEISGILYSRRLIIPVTEEKTCIILLRNGDEDKIKKLITEGKGHD